METPEIMNIGVGTKETKSLEAKPVVVASIKIEEVGEKKNKKAVFVVKHPDKLELISISSIKYEQNGTLKTVGSWANLDEDSKLQKGSAIAHLLAFKNKNTLAELEGVEIETVLGDKGFLAFKAY